MARMDRLTLEVQAAVAGGAPDDARARERVGAVARALEEAAALRPFGDGDEGREFAERNRTAVAAVRALAAGPWTADNRTDRFAALKNACAACHEKDFIDDRLLAARKKVGPGDGLAASLAALAAKPSREACGTCHADVLAEWEGTLHARAWVDPLYRRSFPTGEPTVMCRSCHSMMPILAGEISTSVEWRPEFRPENRDDGISCLACHGLADGAVAAAHDRPDAPCRPRRDPRISTPEFCGACHNPTHGAYDEWKSSQAAAAGRDCNACHTQAVTRTGADGKPRPGVSHRWLGGFDAGLVKSSIRAETRIETGAVVATVENLTSHKFPGEVPTRALIVRVRSEDAAGAEIGEEDVLIRRPFKTEVGTADNRLLPDETRTFRVPLPPGARRVGVQYLFRTSPFAPPEEWIVMKEWTGEGSR